MSEPITIEPTAQQITRFLELFNALDAFESQQHFIRGYGAFDRATVAMPDPAAVAVLSWLKEKADG